MVRMPANSEPSTEDITITKKLVECGKILEISVFDHIIFAGDQMYVMFSKRYSWYFISCHKCELWVACRIHPAH